MNSPKNTAISDYDYPLPDERIAKFPLAQRDHSKLLIYDQGEIKESRFFEIPNLLPDSALLVFNNTKVIHARLLFRKPTGSIIEVFCLEPWQMPVAQAFELRRHSTWLCFVGNNKKWKGDSLSRAIEIEGSTVTLTATRREAVTNAWIVDFDWDSDHTLSEIIEAAGVIPLPPYLHRDAEEEDNSRYQTVYAMHEGSVAAPTAGLHFTEEVLRQLREKKHDTEFVTLHVGAGTFKPVSSDTIGEHEMHVEKVQISRQNIERIIQQSGKPIIPVGTTTVRTLESVYWFGVQLALNPDTINMHVKQWDPYELAEKALSMKESYCNVLAWMDKKETDFLDGDTQLLIAPGYTYRVATGLITNFHQPKSTLLLLVSALIGEDWKACYQYALDHEFRFLSYGDSCLLLPQHK